jgi:hypothetical protein
MLFLNLKITRGYKVIYVFVWIFVMDIKKWQNRESKNE